MHDLQDWADVQRVYKQTRSKRATAKILGMSRNTVRSISPVYRYLLKIDEDLKDHISSKANCKTCSAYGKTSGNRT